MSSLTDRVKAARGGPGAALDVAEKKVATTRHVLERMAPEFAKALPKHIPADMYIRAALTSVQKTPQLLDCTPESFLGALMACAQLGLMPGTKEAALVPYGKTCTLIPQWQGLVAMMYRSGQVESVVAEFICENDEWMYMPSKRPPDDFFHAPAKTDRGEITHAYAFAWLLNGGRSRVALLNEDDAVYIRNRFSKVWAQAEANGKKNSFWHTDFHAAWRKSAVRRIADWVPTSAELRWYLANEEDDGITATHPLPPRPPDVVADGVGEARAALARGDTAVAARLLGEPEADAARVAGERPVDDVPLPELPADGEIATDEPRKDSSQNWPVPAGAEGRRDMFAAFQTYLPRATRDDILLMLSQFTGRPITASSDLAEADIDDVNDAWQAAGAGTDADQGTVAAAFTRLCGDAATGNDENEEKGSQNGP